MNFGMAEQYGIPCTDVSAKAFGRRAKKQCPFSTGQCNKSGGVCSITDGTQIAVVCPRRFEDAGLMYETVSTIAFGITKNVVALPEIRFLKPVHAQGKAVGNIDNVVARIEGGKLLDWCALEVQAVYFSGAKMGGEIKYFEEKRKLPKPGQRRPDFRSSGPKRLLPQLEIKVPTLRRWGKKMFVAIDQAFFEWLPPMKAEKHISNADVCWVSFGLKTSENPNKLFHHKTVLTTLEQSREGLVAGNPSDITEFEMNILSKARDDSAVIWRGE